MPFEQYSLIIYLAVIFVVFYFFLIRPQRKKDKDISRMRRHLQTGDEVTTVGGITGKILKVSDDDIVIETGTAKTKLTLKKWAVSTKESGGDTPDEKDEKADKKAVKAKAGDEEKSEETKED